MEAAESAWVRRAPAGSSGLQRERLKRHEWRDEHEHDEHERLEGHERHQRHERDEGGHGEASTVSMGTANVSTESESAVSETTTRRTTCHARWAPCQAGRVQLRGLLRAR